MKTKKGEKSKTMEKTKTKSLSVLLIHPEISRTKYNFVGVIENECLELEYISALLQKEGHKVTIYDGQVEKKTVESKIKECNPNLVYVCGRTRQENFMLEYCHTAKKYSKETITIIGGLHAQLCFDRMYKDYVDYILTTFDIYKLIEIINYHFGNKQTDLSNVDGICYQNNGVWVKNKPCVADINKLPLPDRTYFYDHPKNYRYLELEHSAWVRTAYCCPYKCKFCHRNKMNSGQYVCRDIKAVVEEIENINSKNIYIVDDDFLFDRDRLFEFVKLIKEKNVKKKYICYGRSDFIANNEDVLTSLKEIGLYYVLVGLEAINDNKLSDYNKKSNVENNEKSIALCNKLDINIMGMFILDLDYTSKDFKTLYKWIKDHHLKHVAISIFTPEMNTEVFDEYKDRIITNNPSHWDYLHLVAKPSKMSVKRYYFNYYKLLIKLFLKAKREGVYDFIDYGDYIASFVKNIFKSKRSNDDE